MSDVREVGWRVRDAVERWVEPEGAERFARRALAVAVLAYVGVALWFTRSGSFTGDELPYFVQSDGFSPGSIAEPFFGHLIAITRLFFEASLRVFGAEYLPFRLLTILLAATAAVLLFVLVKRRVGPIVALVPAVMLLFLGSTPEVLQSIAVMWVQASVAGLAAFVALDRRSRAGDVVACVLLIAAVLSFEVGVAFAIGAAAWIAAERGWRRLWIAAGPLALYAAWWIWALKFDQGSTAAANVLLAPGYAADSLAAAAAALTGLGIDLTGEVTLSPIAIGWGRVVAAIGVVVAIVGARRWGVSATLLWGAIAFLSAMWIAGAVAYEGSDRVKPPDIDRYAYPVVIGAVLALAASFRGAIPSRRALLVLLGLVAFALPANLWQMRERGAFVRAASDQARARLAVIELERDLVPPEFTGFGFALRVRADEYFRAIDRFGSLGYSAADLASASSLARQQADETLGGILSPSIAALGEGKLECAGEGSEAQIPPGGAVLRSQTGGAVGLRRFAATPAISAGALAPGQAGRLVLPVDESSQPWTASVGSGALEVCEITSKG